MDAKETNSELLGRRTKVLKLSTILPAKSSNFAAANRKGERKQIKEKNQKKINKESPTDYSEAVDYTRVARSVGQTKFFKLWKINLLSSGAYMRQWRSTAIAI